MRILITDSDLAFYKTWIQNHHQGSLWQSLEWKTYQEALGREVKIYIEEKDENIVASALVVIDRTTLDFSTWDIARGPLIAVGSWQLAVGNALLDTIVSDAKKDRCFALYLSPPIALELTANCYKPTASPRHEKPEATRIIDLTQSEENILSQMKQKGRYNIRVAEKSGVTVQESQDIEAFIAIVKETAQRQGLRHPPTRHYESFLRDLPHSFLLLASLPPTPDAPHPTPIAGLLGAVWGTKGTYYYGASSYAYRATMAPYALQWESMKKCKALGCQTYDLFGIAPISNSKLQIANMEPHPWKGISEFKEKFGGEVIEYPPEQEIVLRPFIKIALGWKRKIF